MSGSSGGFSPHALKAAAKTPTRRPSDSRESQSECEKCGLKRGGAAWRGGVRARQGPGNTPERRQGGGNGPSWATLDPAARGSSLVLPLGLPPSVGRRSPPADTPPSRRLHDRRLQPAVKVRALLLHVVSQLMANENMQRVLRIDIDRNRIRRRVRRQRQRRNRNRRLYEYDPFAKRLTEGSSGPRKAQRACTSCGIS